MVIGDFLKDTASEHPDRVALVFREHRFTYQEADRRSNQLARALLHSGVKTGDRVAIFNTESHRSLEIIFGSAKAVSGAGLADLMAVDGISETMARTIHDFFHAKG